MIKRHQARNIFNIISSLFSPKVKNLPLSKPILLPEEIIEISSAAIFSINSKNLEKNHFGTGFFITSDGVALTANHVIDTPSKHSAQLNSGHEYPFKVLQRNTKVDLALIKFELPTRASFLSLGNSSLSRQGEQVLVIGSPNPDPFKEFCISYISSANHDSLSLEPAKNSESFSLDEHRSFFILTQQKLRKGFSGAPLINFKGDVIGLHIQNMQRVNTEELLTEAVFVPSNILQLFVDGKLAGKTCDHSLGVYFEELYDGLLVMKVEDKSVAQRAGIAVGDLIVMVNGKEIKKYSDFVSATSFEQPKNLNLKVKRISSFFECVLKFD